MGKAGMTKKEEKTSEGKEKKRMRERLVTAAVKEFLSC